jgi:hypothetical protein
VKVRTGLSEVIWTTAAFRDVAEVEGLEGVWRISRVHSSHWPEGDFEERDFVIKRP